MRFTLIQKEHFNSILTIADQALGKNYITLAHLNKLISLEQYYGYVALDGDQVVGFTSLIILPADDIPLRVLSEHQWFNEIAKGYNQVGLRKQTIVDPTRARKGIGYQLFDYSSKAAELLCDMQISTVWKKEGPASMQRLLVKCGFSYTKTIPKYWYEDSVKNNYNCGVCGLPPCQCAAEVYIKKNAPA